MMKIVKGMLIITILITAILIGTPIQYNCVPINIAIILMGIVFFLYVYIRKKEKVVMNKFDMAVLVLCISPLIPIICRTYINLEDTIIYLLKYISCFIIYVLSKYLVEKDKKRRTVVINTFIIASVILCIIGIDNMTTKILTKPLEELGLPFVFNLENRMFSSLGYANSFAIILATSIMLSLYCMENTMSKYKGIYAGAIFLNLSCLILTYSRATLLFLMLALVLYTFINYDKNKFVIIGYTIITNGAFSIFYMMKWNQLIGKEDYISLWIITLILIVVAIVCQTIGEKIQAKMVKIPIKIYISIVTIIGVLIIIFIIIGMKLVVPLSIFQEGETNKPIKYKIANIKPDTEYSFLFDIQAKSNWKKNNNYEIIIDEEDKYYNLITSHKMTFNEIEGIQEIAFKSTKETKEVAIYFQSQSKKAQKRFDS